MRTIPFIKMHGAQNDFVVIDLRPNAFAFHNKDVSEICDRHKGVGCDQLVTLENSTIADVKVTFYNQDGSVSGACGNASRCVGALIMLQNESDVATIETAAGVLECYNAEQSLDSGEALYVVSMGMAKYEWHEIPLERAFDTKQFSVPLVPIQEMLKKNGHSDLAQVPFPFGDASCVSMGNPHAVFFVDDAAEARLDIYGPVLEHHPIFPERANIGIAEIINKDEIVLRVFERGSGETMACGSGACAAVAAGFRRQILSNKVLVHLKGGDLLIEITETGEILLMGPVAVVFTGMIEM